MFASLKPEIGGGEEVTGTILGEAEASKLVLNFIWAVVTTTAFTITSFTPVSRESCKFTKIL